MDLDEEEAGEFYDAMESIDTDEDNLVSWDEWEAAVIVAMEEDPELKWLILEDATVYVNEFDVDCSLDGVEGCEDERANMHEEIAEYAE